MSDRAPRRFSARFARAPMFASEYLPSFLLTITLVLAFASSCDRSKPNPKDTLADVGGRALTRGEFENFSSFHLAELAGEAVDYRVKSRLLDECIKLRTVVQEAERLGVKLTEEELSAGRASRARDPEVKKRAEKERDELSPKETELSRSLLASKYYSQIVLATLAVTPEELSRYIAQNADRLKSSEGYVVREIRVETAGEAEELHRELTAKRKDFVEVARSRTPSAAGQRDGAVFYQRGELPEELEQAVAKLKVGAVSPVVHSSYGYHIFRLERRGDQRSPQELHDMLRDELIAAKSRDLINREVESLVARTPVRVYFSRLGFEYDGVFRAASR